METDVNAFTVQVTKRMSSNWQLTSSLTYRNPEGRLGSSNSAANHSAKRAPVQLVRAEPQRVRQHLRHVLNADRPWTFKTQLVYQFPLDFLVGLNFQYTDGAPRDSQSRASTPMTGIPTQVQPLAPRQRSDGFRARPSRLEGAKGLRARSAGNAHRSLHGCVEPSERGRLRDVAQLASRPRRAYKVPDQSSSSRAASWWERSSRSRGFRRLRPRTCGPGGAATSRQDSETLFRSRVPQAIVEAHETDALLVFRKDQSRSELKSVSRANGMHREEPARSPSHLLGWRDGVPDCKEPLEPAKSGIENAARKGRFSMTSLKC